MTDATDTQETLPEWMDITAAIQDESLIAAAGAGGGAPAGAAEDADRAPEDAPEGQQDLSATDGRAGATGRRAVTHNQHDVDALERECQRLHVAIAERGAQVDAAALTARAQAFTAIKLLVERGICTEAEAQGALLTEIRNMLAGILQQVEVQRLHQAQAQRQQAGPQVQAVRKPDLILPASATRRPPPRRQHD